MSGIAQIIQAMMSVTPQVTQMGGMQGGGGGGGAVGLGGSTNVSMSPMQRPGGPQQTQPVQMPQNPMMQQQGAPQGQAPTANIPPAMMQDIPPSLQRQLSEAQIELERLNNPRNIGDAWESRKAIPAAQEEYAMAQANLQAWQQAQMQDAQQAQYEKQQIQTINEGKQVATQALNLTDNQDFADQIFQMWLAGPEGQKSAAQAMEEVYQQAFQEEKAGTTINNIPTPEKGYRNVFDDQGRLVEQEVIPGGPVDREIKDTQQKNQKLYRRLVSDSEGLADTVTQAFNDTGIFTAGPLGMMLAQLPGTPAKDLEQLMERVKANVANATIGEMKSESHTGATGLGQVQIKEYEGLQRAKGSVEQAQSPTQLKEALEDILVWSAVNAEIHRNNEKYEAMPDDEYFQWRREFAQGVIDNLNGPKPKEFIWNPNSGTLEEAR